MMTELELRTYFAACELRIIILEQRFLELRYNHNHDSKGRFTFSSGGGAFPNGKNTEKTKIVLTDFLNDDTIEDKEKAFKQAVRDGRVNTKIEDSKQCNHIIGKPWKNQVKQAVKTINDPDPKKRKTPKSVLDRNLNPQELVKEYGGTGKIKFSRDKKTANEFVTFSKPIGRTFDMRNKRYVSSYVLQIKYCDSGTHAFPTIKEGD